MLLEEGFLDPEMANDLVGLINSESAELARMVEDLLVAAHDEDIVAPVAVAVPPTEEGPRAGVVVASTALWQPPPTSNEAILAEVPRAVVTAFNSGILSLPELKFPLLLLAIALLLGLTFGRISVLPFGAIRRYEEGWVQAYDEAHEVGTVIPDGGASEVFVHGRSLEKMESLAPGQRVRFVAAETRGRRLALRAWPTTTP